MLILEIKITVNIIGSLREILSIIKRNVKLISFTFHLILQTVIIITV